MLVKAAHHPVDGPQQGLHLVVAPGVVVEVLQKQLGVQVAGAPAHALDAGVDEQRPAGAQLHQGLGVGVGQLQVVVRVEPHLDALGQVVLNQVEKPQHVLALHGSKAVHQVKGVGPQLVGLFNELQVLLVRVAQSHHGLQKHLVALLLDAPRRLQRRAPVLLVECHPDAVQGAAVPGGQLLHVVGAVVQQRHKEPARPILRQQPRRLLQGVEPGVVLLIGLFLGQKAALDDVHPRLDQAVHQIAAVGQAKMAVVAVAPVPQCAVQHAHPAHRQAPFPSWSP